MSVEKVVIAGRDVALWLTANALIRAFGRTGLRVEVVELPSLLRPHDVIAALPALEPFHRRLGFEEADLVTATSGAWSLGQGFANFSGAGPAFFNPYGTHGSTINNVPFLQVWLRARAGGLKVDYGDFCLNAVAARHGRFFTPNDDTREIGPSGYGLHLRAQPYVQVLKAAALRQGVTVHASRDVEARIDGETGRVTAVVLRDGRAVDGDLFIDATGRESALLGGALKVGFDSWRQWFAHDRVLTTGAAGLSPMPAYAQTRALASGCLLVTPVRGLTGLTLTYRAAETSDEEALRTIATVSQLKLHNGASVDTLEPGRRSVAWAGNVVGIGEAAAVFAPIDSLSLHAIQLGVANLIAHFPCDVANDWERREYNRRMASHLERARDYQIAHFKLNRNFDRPFWDACRNMAIPDKLAWKIEMFKARGIVPVYDDETFEPDNWEAAFLGHGMTPEAYDPLADQLPEAGLMHSFQRLLQAIKANVERMDAHDAWLERLMPKSYA